MLNLGGGEISSCIKLPIITFPFSWQYLYNCILQNNVAGLQGYNFFFSMAPSSLAKYCFLLV
jgi:hypothetical protein